MTSNDQEAVNEIDLVGREPYALIESDPVIFTSIMQKMGVVGLEAQEILTLDSLEANFRPFGFVFCFKWSEDSYHLEDYHNDVSDTAVPWFANQLSDDSCATLALLNILLNCEEVDIGPTLSSFKDDTTDMEPLVIKSSWFYKLINHREDARPVCSEFCSAAPCTQHICPVAWFHQERPTTNDLSPIDVRASVSKIAHTTLHPPRPTTKGKKTSGSKKKIVFEPSPDAYHFLSYVPHRGRVWEMDGLKRAPLECSEIEDRWLDAALPALRGRMDSLSKSGDIRFNLLAIVPSKYQSKADELELGKRRVIFLERRLAQEYGESWKTQVSDDLHRLKEEAFSKHSSTRLGVGFGSRSNDAALSILRMDSESLLPTWRQSVQQLTNLQLEVGEEIQRGIQNEAEHIKRTHDYDPFIQQYIGKLYNAGFLQDLLDIDGSGRPRQPGKGKKR